jgi:hypothetical protein
MDEVDKPSRQIGTVIDFVFSKSESKRYSISNRHAIKKRYNPDVLEISKNDI